MRPLPLWRSRRQAFRRNLQIPNATAPASNKAMLAGSGRYALQLGSR